jgi:hemoglobin
LGGIFTTEKIEMPKHITLMALMSLMTVTLPAASGGGTVYKSLDGKKAIVAVVDGFVARVAADNRINTYFKQTASDPARLAKFKKNLADQICEATGGPCKYTGRDMKSAHAGMGISSPDFAALVEDLVATLDGFHVKEQDKSALLAALGPTKGDIVEK